MKIAQLILLALVVLGGMLTYGQVAASRDRSTLHYVEALAKIEPIDAHSHIYIPDPSVTNLLHELNLRLLDILVIDDRDKFYKELEPQ